MGGRGGVKVDEGGEGCAVQLRRVLGQRFSRLGQLPAQDKRKMG